MFWINRSIFDRGDVVKFRTIPQLMEVTYVDRNFFSDKIQVIFQSEDGKMNTLSGIHPNSLELVI